MKLTRAKEAIIRVGSAERGGEKHKRGSGEDAKGERRGEAELENKVCVTEKRGEEEI